MLLYRQDELRDLEDQLIRLDDEDQEENPKALQSRKLDDAREGSYRRGLIQLIDDKLEEYGRPSRLYVPVNEYPTNKHTLEQPKQYNGFAISPPRKGPAVATITLSATGCTTKLP